MIPIKRQISVLVWHSCAILVLASGVASGCAKAPPMPASGQVDAAGDVSSVDHVSGGSDGPSSDHSGGSDVRIDSAIDIPPGSLPTPPANVLFPDPPELSCAVASDCDFPPSACADLKCGGGDGGFCSGYQWVVYYDNPRCTVGKCEFDPLYFHCVGGYACSAGGCRFNGTAVAAP